MVHHYGLTILIPLLSEHFCSDYSASVKSINKGPFFYNLGYNVHWDIVHGVPNVDDVGSR